MSRQDEQRRRALKPIRTHSSKSKFSGTCEENWHRHTSDYTDVCAVYDVPDTDKIFFLRISLTGEPRDFYNSITQDEKRWNIISDMFSERFVSPRKQKEISNTLQNLSLVDVIENCDDD